MTLNTLRQTLKHQILGKIAKLSPPPPNSLALQQRAICSMGGDVLWLVATDSWNLPKRKQADAGQITRSSLTRHAFPQRAPLPQLLHRAAEHEIWSLSEICHSEALFLFGSGRSKNWELDPGFRGNRGRGLWSTQAFWCRSSQAQFPMWYICTCRVSLEFPRRKEMIILPHTLLSAPPGIDSKFTPGGLPLFRSFYIYLRFPRKVFWEMGLSYHFSLCSGTIFIYFKTRLYCCVREKITSV